MTNMNYCLAGLYDYFDSLVVLKTYCIFTSMSVLLIADLHV